MTPLNEVKILVVDDDSFMRHTIRQMLRMQGPMTVEEAADGEKALEMMPRLKPHAVICDIAMTPLSGIDFLRQLRAHEEVGLRDTPVIMLTAKAETAIVQEALKLGISGYLLKPVSIKELKSRVEVALTWRERQKAAS